MRPAQFSPRAETISGSENESAKRIMLRRDFSRKPLPNSGSNCLDSAERQFLPHTQPRFSFSTSAECDRGLPVRHGQAGVDSRKTESRSVWIWSAPLK